MSKKPTDNIYIGKCGENAAAEYMKSCGYEIRERNYKTIFGEIDIIAKKDEYIVFCEVKSRSNINYGEPCEAVNIKKQQKIIRTAYNYIEENNVLSNFRFDVCEVFHKITSDRGYEVKKINYIEGAFEC